MNNEVLVNIYSDNLTDAEAESLFSTTKESKRGDRRKIDYKKAKRKARIDLARSCDGLEHCRLYPDKQVKTFLTQHAAKIADVYADEAEELVKYIQAGVFSDTALKKMMTELEANKKGRDRPLKA